MEHLNQMVKFAENEMGAIAQNGKFRSREEIDSVYKLMDIIKDAYCIMDMEEEGDEGYSRDYRGSYRGGGYEGGSYARGRGRNVRRDSMGRYSRNGGSYRGYSRADGKQEYIENLRDMMEDAPDEQTRQSIKRMIEQMES